MYDDIMSCWTAHDATTFLIGLEEYRPDLFDFLTIDEKAQAFRCKPVIARRRIVLSRAILKHILRVILSEKKVTDIILTRDTNGRILVKDTPHVFISLSYFGTCIAITVGKRKLGSDIEGVRPVRNKKITDSPFFRMYPCTQGGDCSQHIIHVWTLIESYAKLYDKNPYPLLNSCYPFMDAEIVSYYINQHMIFSLASTQERLTEIMTWLDIWDSGSPIVVL